MTLQATVIASLLGIGVSVALLFGADTALALMGADASSGDLHEFAKQYLSVRCARQIIDTASIAVFKPSTQPNHDICLHL